MMKHKLKAMLLFFLILVLSVSTSAYADDGVSNSSKQGTIFQYGENGGILFSFPMIVQSQLNWSRLPGQYTNFKRSEAIVYVPAGGSYGISSCNTQVALRPSTNIGSSKVNLPYRGTYWVDPNAYAFYAGRISTNESYPWNTIATRYIPFTATIDNEANAFPSPNLCFGGGTVTDTFTVSH